MIEIRSLIVKFRRCVSALWIRKGHAMIEVWGRPIAITQARIARVR